MHTFEHHVQELLPLLAGSRNGETVKVDDLFFRFTLDAATDFLFASSVGSLQNGEVGFATAFADAQNIQATIARAGPLRGLVSKKKFHKVLGVINRFVDRYIDEALQLPKE